MIHYSVLIPQRNAADACGRLLPQLREVLDNLILPYEIICIDDASQATDASDLAGLLDECEPLRVLRFDLPRGVSAALSAGMAAARGDLIIVLDVRTRGAAALIPQFIARLSRHDLVYARFARSWGAWWRKGLSGLPRLLVADPRLHVSEDLFWVARREAVAGLALARGAFRVLPALVARRGFRICRLTLFEDRLPQGETWHPTLLHRLLGRWFERRFEPHLAREVARTDTSQLLPNLKLARVEIAHHRVLPQVALLPSEEDRRDSA